MSDVQTTPGSQAALRRANRDRVIAALRESGSLTQAEIARATGLSAASVSNIVRDLRAVGAVSVRQTHSNGRRARAVTLRRSPGAVVGIDFGHDRITAALGDAEGATLARETIAYDVAADPGRGVRRAVWLVETVLAAARVDLSSVRAVCAAVPGPVDLDTGEVGAITCMPAWAGARPGADLSDRLGVPVAAENDANLAARAELAEGAGRGLRHLVYVRLAEGVGAGIVVDGRVFPGAGGTAGEIGHLGLDERGQVCRCGNRGCLETHVGARYLLEMLPARGAGGTPATVAELVAAADAGDPGARRVVAEAGTSLGRALAMLVNAFNPEALVIGGDLAEAGEDLMEPMRRSLELGALGTAVQRVKVARGSLGADAVLRGALASAAASADTAV